ncbi:MAG TPA: hypothetical protein VH325_08125 [Bryobacteraceae bacterium]|jgi:uncharacterized protein (TIGR03437 family)|nr:hypothetical protein [Bryobacteraceae bacterium]
MKSFRFLSLIGIFAATSVAWSQTQPQFITGQAARAVIGQYSFDLGTQGASAQILGGVTGIAYANGTLFAADDNLLGAQPNNQRVMMFNTNQIPAPKGDISTFSGFDTYCNICGFPAFNVLGQPDYGATPPTPGRTASAMNTPTAVATDGTILAVADTNNNRVMIWNSIPTSINAPANLVLGQPDLNSFQTPNTVNASTLRGPQGVWIQNGKLFVADTLNYRVLIWNSIPTTNNQPADIVLGQKNFTSVYQPPVAANLYPSTNAAEMLNPVGVSSDGTHLFVADLGFNRILIWNQIPTQNDQPANVEIGQPDMTTSVPDNTTTGLCASTGTSSTGAAEYPSECAATIQFPRFALADNTGRLFVADGGNDRVLIFNQIPTTNGASADIVLGQPNMFVDVVTSASISIISTVIDNTGSVDTIANPSSLAWDGTNLYVSDPWDERVLVYTPADIPLQEKATLNAASLSIRQEGFVVLQLPGSIVAKDTVSITIGTATYTYTLTSTDTLDTITAAIIKQINNSNSGAGDPNVIALAGSVADTVYLDSRATNLDADTIALAATSSDSTNITATASGGYLTGGTSATVAPGTLIQISNPAATGVPNLSDFTETANPSSSQGLPFTLGGVQVSVDGLLSPILSVSPTTVVSQIPFNFTEKNSSSVYVRTVHTDGSVTVTTASPVYLTLANPGLFATPNVPEPRPVFNAMHQSTNPSATVSIDGSVHAGDVATITVAGTAYNYTVVAADTLATIAQNLAAVINKAVDPYVTASVGGAFTRVVLTARQPAPVGAGITIAGSASSSADVTVTAYQSATCCTDNDGQVITAADPAQPNETITLYGTGLGQVTDPATSTAENYAVAGVPYNGPQPNSATNFVTATVNAETGQVVSAGLVPGGIGMYGMQVILPGDLTPNATTQVYVAQNAFISNVVTLPVGFAGGQFTANPNPILAGNGATTGVTTLTWNVSQSSVEIHLGSPSGPLFGTGGATGSGTTGNWVTDGMKFYLQDPTQGTTIATVTAHVLPIGGTLTASPNPILVAPGNTSPQTTTLSWYAPNSTAVEVHLGSPGGTLFTGGGSQGASTTPNWVTDGMTFYLQDATNGNSNSPSNTLASTTVHIQTNPSQFAANPNPIILAPGSTLGETTLTWTVPNSTATEIHLGSATGPLFSRVNGPTGTAATGYWVSNGMTFYLQDVSSGAASSSNTVGVVTAQLATGGTLTATPNPISVGPNQLGATTVTWDAPFATAVEVHLGSPSGPLFAGGGTTGSAATGAWVTDGMVFYLQNATNGNATSPSNTIATVTAHLSMSMPGNGGSDPPPFAPRKWPR